MATILEHPKDLPVTDMDNIFNDTDQLNMQSDSSLYGSSSLEFIIPPSKVQKRIAIVENERNIKPSTRPNEYDLRAAAASKRLKLPKFGPMFTDLIFWTRPKISAIVFGIALAIQFSLLVSSVISVVAYFFLSILMGSAGMRVYFRIINAAEANPLNSISNCDIRLSPVTASELSQILTSKLNNGIVFARDIFLLRSLGKSIKFGAALYSLTYVGARFNFLTICICGTILAFTVPKLCDLYHVEINNSMKYTASKTERLLDRIWKRSKVAPSSGTITKN